MKNVKNPDAAPPKPKFGRPAEAPKEKGEEKEK